MSHLAAKDELRRLRSGAAALSVSQSRSPEGRESETVLPGDDWPQRPTVELTGEVVDRSEPSFSAPWWRRSSRSLASYSISGAAHAILLVALGLTVLTGNEAARWIGLEVAIPQREEATQPLVAVEMTAAAPEPNAVGGDAPANPEFAMLEAMSLSPVTTDLGELAAGGGSVADEMRSIVGDGADLGLAVGGEGAGTSSAIGAGTSSERSGGNDYALFYGTEARGTRFVYVVDCSQSMTGARFDKACSELLSSILTLGKKQSFYVVFFNTEEFPQFYPVIDNFLSAASTASFDKLSAWMRNVRPMGGTNPAPALKRALQLEPDAIFLLSDGEFDLRPSMQVIHNFNRSRAVIHTVALGSPAGRPMLEAIAAATGGTYRFVPLVP
jgi:hypothetical protein